LIKKSPEIAAIATRFAEAVATGNIDRVTLANILSSSEHLRYLGSGPDEYFSGRLFREGYADHLAEFPDHTVLSSNLEAFEAGEVGWAIVNGELLIDGKEEADTYRSTIVFVLEGGIWKIAHIHVSNPKPSIEVIGRDHEVFDHLIQTARDSYAYAEDESTATVMFTDIANSTSIASLLGDRMWATAVNLHLEMLSQAIGENGGTVVKTLGDGTMSTFSSARAAMSAARKIQNIVTDPKREPRLEVRIGIHTGDVIQADGIFSARSSTRLLVLRLLPTLIRYWFPRGPARWSVAIARIVSATLSQRR